MMTLVNQLLNRDALQRSAVFLDQVEHFAHSVIVMSVVVSESRAYLFPKSNEGLGNHFLCRSKVT
jgi:uncharacterized protein YpiB (UPF0302 family)